ncbi:ATP-binding protein [Pseudodesulfovibrio thermohalotolerans]|uniref:two-component system sensor histidine kinase NtrB n=1 Tax=Pseudodesulfovibrio thermohalotolerans TaxID=2880651 RepID=UPI00244139D6|nr:ATP-binding protein [Pseudodesulfovibrio thermohalotolerans]WFS61780.1 ATP-binding protein [Pseudodesulfovibrio thermohalotolerans]
MDDFAYENLGICYWNGTLGPFNVGVVGTGPMLQVMLDIIYNEAFREFLPEMCLAAISNAPQSHPLPEDCETCPVYPTYREMLDAHPEINLVVEITGDNEIAARLRQELPPSISLIDHRELIFLCGLHDMAVVKGNYMTSLDHQRSLIQSIIDEIREDIFLLDKSGNIQDVNRTVWQRAGVPRKELLGQPCWMAARLRDGSTFCNQLDPVCPFHKTLLSGRKEEALVTRVNGSGLLQYYRLYAYPIFDMRGQMSHIMVMHRDITERTHREKFKQQQDKFAIIGEISTYLAHEIRNPLYAVGGFANALLRSPKLDTQEREKVQIIVEETKRLDKLLTNMLNFVRPSHGRGGTVDMVAVSRDAAELMDVGYGRQGYVISVEADDHLPSVEGDADSLKQCLVNIIKNSIEAMPGGGDVVISLTMDGGDVIAQIRDQGTGMSETELDRAFNPFYSTKDEGNGLGLPLIKKIIEESGGSVTLASRPGEGTTVTLRLQPAMDVEHPSEAESDPN